MSLQRRSDLSRNLMRQHSHNDAETDVPSGDAIKTKARCTFASPDDADQGFDILVEATRVQAA
ncbi:MAG: hypothetical protein ACI9KE_001696 [Polyangiales bacterium]|jgi:hypothetical protein